MEKHMRPALLLIGCLATPLHAQATSTEEVQARQFYCSMVESNTLTEGDDYDNIHTEEDYRPVEVLVPDPDALKDNFSENGRYYYYVKELGDADFPQVLYGTFDLRMERLVVGGVWKGLGRDDVERVYVFSHLWICSEVD